MAITGSLTRYAGKGPPKAKGAKGSKGRKGRTPKPRKVAYKTKQPRITISTKDFGRLS